MTVEAAATTPKSPETKAPAAANGGTYLNSDFETFLKMLSAQMTNQDPLNPMDSSDFAVQLATFSSVEQQVFTNDILKKISASLDAGALTDLAGWIGMTARITGAAAFSGAPVDVVPRIEKNADAAQLIVRDHDGHEVQRYTIDIDSTALKWAGKDDKGQTFPHGLYSFFVESRANNDVLSTRQADVYTAITEARAGEDGPVLIGAGGVAFSSEKVNSLRAAS